MTRALAAAALLLALGAPAPAEGQQLPERPCRTWSPTELRRNATEEELRCYFGIVGPGRFGLLSYVDVPVYQPATPMPGTHLVGVPGHAAPRPGESYEEWEWRMLRATFGPEAHRVYRELEVLDPRAAARILELEARLGAAGIPVVRLETWRAPARQAYLFQQGRSRPGPLATTTLTSWHSQVDRNGLPAGRAVDYAVPGSSMRRFHEIAHEVGLESFGADSNDPGHVFLPNPDELPPLELALLRVIPRIPEVTLATGLPVDRRLPPGGRASIRAATLEFASLPFIPYLVPDVDGPGAAPQVVTNAAAPPAPMAQDGRDAG